MIFSTHEMKYFWYLTKKSKFSFYFFRKGEKLNFFHNRSSLILLGSARLVGKRAESSKIILVLLGAFAPRKWLIMSF